MSRALIALGANLGDRAAALTAALDALGHLPGTRVVRASSWYDTDPVPTPGGATADQPAFLNGVAEVETALSPRALLGACLGIEAAAGRVRTLPGGPRCLDLDLLAYEGAASNDPELRLPHPRMAERAFVLVPLAELYPDGRALDVDLSAALHVVDPSGVRLWTPPTGR